MKKNTSVDIIVCILSFIVLIGVMVMTYLKGFYAGLLVEVVITIWVYVDFIVENNKKHKSQDENKSKE